MRASAKSRIFLPITKDLSTKLTGFLLALSIAATSAAGCGGDGDATAGSERTYSVYASTTVTTADLDKAQFVSRVNRICREAWRTVIDNYAVYSSTQDPTLSQRERTKEAIQLSLLAGLDFHIFDEILLLGAPRGQEDDVEAIVGPFQTSVEIGQKHPTADDLMEVPAKFAEYNRLAQQYDLDDCLVDKAHLQRIKT